MPYSECLIHAFRRYTSALKPSGNPIAIHSAVLTVLKGNLSGSLWKSLRRAFSLRRSSRITGSPNARVQALVAAIPLWCPASASDLEERCPSACLCQDMQKAFRSECQYNHWGGKPSSEGGECNPNLEIPLYRPTNRSRRDSWRSLHTPTADQSQRNTYSLTEPRFRMSGCRWD